MAGESKSVANNEGRMENMIDSVRRQNVMDEAAHQGREQINRATRIAFVNALTGRVATLKHNFDIALHELNNFYNLSPANGGPVVAAATDAYNTTIEYWPLKDGSAKFLREQLKEFENEATEAERHGNPSKEYKEAITRMRSSVQMLRILSEKLKRAHEELRKASPALARKGPRNFRGNRAREYFDGIEWVSLGNYDGSKPRDSSKGIPVLKWWDNELLRGGKSKKRKTTRKRSKKSKRRKTTRKTKSKKSKKSKTTRKTKSKKSKKSKRSKKSKSNKRTKRTKRHY